MMVLISEYGLNFFKLMGHSKRLALYKSVKTGSLKRHYAQKTSSNGNLSFIPFMEMIQMRRAQAARSIVVQVQSAQSYKELYTYCESKGKVENMLHYCEGTESMHFIIVEFKSESDVQNVLESGCHIDESQTVPTTSQFLWFRAASRKLAKLKHSKESILSIENGTDISSEIDLKESLRKCNTVSEQIMELYNSTKLNDVGQRLRFLTAKQVETTMSGMFPKLCAFPFGSSVNGFGKMGCDLDIVLRLTPDQDNEQSRLIYHCKAAPGSERSTSQRNMEAVGDLINLFLPGCTQVRRILQARVPIIKFHQQFTNVECDLSMSNMSGVYMSDFLYLMGEIDPRIRPLIFAIRKWAKNVHLTNPSPGKWITNFSLTLLVLAFLQKPLHSPPVLPTLNQLTKLAGPSDRYVTEDGINGTFLRDIRRLETKSRNTSSLQELLLEFFEYYAQFDFTNKAVCLNEAVSIAKPEYSALYIINPLERGLNVSKNVSLEELERFRVEVRNAAWLLESNENQQEDNKGLLAIFENKNNMKLKANMAFSQKYNRLMDVSTLFEEESDFNSEEIDFKNDSVKNQVAKIKKETRESIKTINANNKRQKSQS
ncbi:hypothetical protein ABEB36_002094 [Hypothenemus hampei]|uniref:Poly(A) RNA polymerase, mitochondrial n=1 Tax=Hypothenemus hampei TaxID=57062 RepID=A0ABD1F7N9_HYPHA